MFPLESLSHGRVIMIPRVRGFNPFMILNTCFLILPIGLAFLAGGVELGY